MPILTKNAGAYNAIVGLSAKKNSVYAAVQGAYVKVAGVYQSVLGPPPTIGPYTLGSTYTNGGRSYIATTGDDFNSISFITPGNPAGKYSTTRAYMNLATGNGPRGNSSGGLALKGYDADAGHTGFNDVNRGVAMASFSDLIAIAGGRLQLKTRTATTPERATFVSATPNASGMINTATSHVVMAPFFIDCKMKLTKSQVNMRGWHPTFWMMQMKSVTSFTSTELDWEATSLKIAPEKYAWTSGSSTNNSGTAQEASYVSGTDYLFRIEVLVDGSVNFYSNIASGGGAGAINNVRSLPAGQVADTSRPHYILLTNHVADFPADPYQDADWVAAGSAGAVMDIDYFAILTSVGTLYQPQVASQTYNVDYGAAINIALPSATTLWGSAVTDDIESWAQESNEPGGDYQGGYRNQPLGMTYDASARVISGTPAFTSNKTPPENKSGRIMPVIYTKVPGTACIPYRLVINIGPHMLVDRLPPATIGVPYSYDLYAQADCGVLVSDANGNRAKTLNVTGLTGGLSYDDSTGLITGTPSGIIDTTLTITITNSVGQQATSTASLIAFAADQGVAAPVLTGAPAIRNSWDFDKLASLSVDGQSPPHINSVTPSDGGSLTLANASTTTSPTRILRPNNRSAAKFDKTVSQFLQGTAAQANGGTVVIVYEPITVNSNMQAFERSQGSANSTTNREGMVSIGGTYVAARRGSAAGTTADAQAPNALNTAALHVAVMEFDPASVGATAVTLYFDGGSTAYNSSTGQPANMDTVTMGGRYAASALSLPFDGYIYRVIDYPTVLSAAQAEQVAVWARRYYGTPNAA
jgi:hypothetical protein